MTARPRGWGGANVSLTLKIVGVQMAVSRELDENLPRLLPYVERAGRQGADWILFPEMSLTGYHGEFDRDAGEAGCEEFAAACRAANVNGIVGAGAWIEGECYIQTRAYSRQGKLIGTHEKMVPTSGDRKFCSPGKELRVFDHEGLRFGMQICNDLWVTPGCGPYPDPRLCYQLGQKGARVVFHAINSGSSQEHLPYHESNLALRARESKFHIATANAAKDHPVNASSGVMGPDGQWIVTAPRDGEGIYAQEITLE